MTLIQEMHNDDNSLYIVSGFMRCGTSMMMKALEEAGLFAEYKNSRDDRTRKPHIDEHYDPNEGGLYELERSDYLTKDFPRKYKGKLIKCLYGGLERMNVMPDGINIVFMRRDFEEIRQSYQAFFGQKLKFDKSVEESFDLMIQKMLNRKDVNNMHVFWYREVVEEPYKHFKILKDAGWPIDIDKAVEVVNPDLCRFRKESLVEGII